MEGVMKKGRVVTELNGWLRAASPQQQQELCERAGISLSYIRLIANAYRENPKLRLALSLVKEANRITAAHNKGKSVVKMPYVTILGLATPTRRGYEWPAEDTPRLKVGNGTEYHNGDGNDG